VFGRNSWRNSQEGGPKKCAAGSHVCWSQPSNCVIQ
jgi:hypothetical protein